MALPLFSANFAVFSVNLPIVGMVYDGITLVKVPAYLSVLQATESGKRIDVLIATFSVIFFCTLEVNLKVKTTNQQDILHF